MACRHAAGKPGLAGRLFGDESRLRSGLVGTPEKVRNRLAEFEEAGVDLLLLQCSPQLEEMERFGEEVIRSRVPGGNGPAQPNEVQTIR